MNKQTEELRDAIANIVTDQPAYIKYANLFFDDKEKVDAITDLIANQINSVLDRIEEQSVESTNLEYGVGLFMTADVIESERQKLKGLVSKESQDE